MDTIVKQQYNRLASIYDQRWQGYITNTLSFLVTWAEIDPREQVLDVACGTGELERQLTEKHPQQRIVGVDFSENMLAIARQKCQTAPHVTFQAAPASALPWSTATFDTITCANAFHYFNQPHAALAEMKRVLNPDGRIIILDWCRDFIVCQVCDWVLSWIDPAHQQCYSEVELHDLVRNAGYHIQRHQRLRFGLIWGLMVLEATPINRSKP